MPFLLQDCNFFYIFAYSEFNKSLNLLIIAEFFQNNLVDTIQFMEILNLKDNDEKDTFFRKLPTLAEQLPREIVLNKVLYFFSCVKFY